MTLVVIGSLKGSPGVSTLTAMMAYQWPQHRRMALVEADADGGVLAARFGLHPESPSLVSFAASARHGYDQNLFWESCQRLPGGPMAMVVPSSGRSVSRSLQQVDFTELDGCLIDTDLLLDAGRLRQEGSSQKLCEGAGLLVMVVRPIFEDLAVLLHRASALAGHVKLGVVIVGDGPYPPEEIEEALTQSAGQRSSVLGSVAWDPRGAEGLTSEASRNRVLRRSYLARTAKHVTELVVRLIPRGRTSSLARGGGGAVASGAAAPRGGAGGAVASGAGAMASGAGAADRS